jgi:hypothetical protein
MTAKVRLGSLAKEKKIWIVLLLAAIAAGVIVGLIAPHYIVIRD